MAGRRKVCSCCTAVVSISVLVSVGVILICLGAASVPLFDSLYAKELKKKMVLKKGSESYDNWRVPPVPIYMKFYIFNYTNVDEFLATEVNPNVAERGPYSYRELLVNEVIEEDDYAITYLANKTYVFDPTTSCEDCRENDTLTVVNVAILTLMEMLKDLNIKNPGWVLKGMLELLNGFINADKDFTVFTKLTVHQLLWGYVNPVLHIIKKSEYFFSLLKIKLPPINDVVALQYNGTEGAKHDGNLTISTGDDNVDNTQKFLKWKGLSDAPYWLTKYGEMLNGTDGTRFKLFLSRDDRLFVFNTQLCRSIYLEYDSDDSIMGVPLYRYSTTSYLFANSSVNPDNAAFCGPKRCYGSGLLPIGQCQTGNPPVFASAPHFYQGDKELLEAIDGLRPNKSLHGTFISVEPRTGMTFAAQKRLQINVMAQPNEYFDIMDPFKRNFTFLPLIWAQEGAVIDKANVEKFKDLVDTPKLILKWASNGIMILGAILVFIGLVLAAIRRRRRTRKYSVLKNENLDDGLSKVT